MSAKQILIIDDHQLFADGLALILENFGQDYTVTIENNAQQVISEQTNLKAASLVLVDLHMPSFDGFAFLSSIRAQNIAVTVAVISGTESQHDIERSISLGAQGFIPKDTPSDEMLNAVNALLKGERYLPAQWFGKIDWLANQDNDKQLTNSLTPRQLEILQLMCDGLQNKQMATVLDISVSSIKGHIELLFKNLNVNNRTACVIQGQKLGLI